MINLKPDLECLKLQAPRSAEEATGGASDHMFGLACS